ELLSRRSDVARKAIIDGSLCIPQPGLARFCIASVRLFGRWMFSEKACRWQLAMMPRMLPAKMLYPDELQRYYLQDMPRLPMETLLTMYRTYMMNYRLKPGIRQNKAQVMYWYGENEMKCVRQSAELSQPIHPESSVDEARWYGHAYLAVQLQEKWHPHDVPYVEQGMGQK